MTILTRYILPLFMALLLTGCASDLVVSDGTQTMDVTR